MPLIDEFEFLDGCEVLESEPNSSPLYDTPEVEPWRALFPAAEKDIDYADAWKALEEIRGFENVDDALLFTQASGRDLGIAARLRDAGLKVIEVAGWQSRGAPSFFPRGSVDHHTAGPRSGNSPSLNICINGRSDLPGPLCHVFIARDNTCYVVASGRANHAGTGGYNGLSGNSSVFGIERENVGTSAEPWRPDQTETAAKAHAALLRGRGLSSNMLCRHAEWTKRKPDTHSIRGFDLRAMCERYLKGTPTPPPPPLPDKVTPLFNPPHVLQPIVDAKPAPEGGVVLLGQDGSIYTYGGAYFFRGANGQPWFEGRKAARLDYVGDPAHPLSDRRWQITASSEEKYHLPF